MLLARAVNICPTSDMRAQEALQSLAAESSEIKDATARMQRQVRGHLNISWAQLRQRKKELLLNQA